MRDSSAPENIFLIAKEYICFFGHVHNQGQAMFVRVSSGGFRGELERVGHWGRVIPHLEASKLN